MGEAFLVKDQFFDTSIHSEYGRVCRYVLNTDATALPVYVPGALAPGAFNQKVYISEVTPIASSLKVQATIPNSGVVTTVTFGSISKLQVVADDVDVTQVSTKWSSTSPTGYVIVFFISTTTGMLQVTLHKNTHYDSNAYNATFTSGGFTVRSFFI